MNTTPVKKIIGILIFGLCLLFSTIAAAYGPWRAGGWHGGGYYGPIPMYYGYQCHTVTTCNFYGHCWVQQNCY